MDIIDFEIKHSRDVLKRHLTCRNKGNKVATLRPQSAPLRGGLSASLKKMQASSGPVDVLTDPSALPPTSPLFIPRGERSNHPEVRELEREISTQTLALKESVAKDASDVAALVS